VQKLSLSRLKGQQWLKSLLFTQSANGRRVWQVKEKADCSLWILVGWQCEIDHRNTLCSLAYCWAPPCQLQSASHLVPGTVPTKQIDWETFKSEYLKEFFTLKLDFRQHFLQMGLVFCSAFYFFEASIKSSPHPLHTSSMNDGTSNTHKALKHENSFHLALELESGLESLLKFLFLLS
jgi:hypothetical protein